MVDQQSVEKAVAVRYTNWAKRCSHFVIVSNGVSLGGEELIDCNTILVNTNHVVQLEFQAIGGVAANNTLSLSEYTTFPSPKNETKQHLTLKSFHSFMQA